MKSWLFWVALSLPLVSASSLGQQIYRWIDSNGQVHFSDQPPPPAVKDVEQKRIPTAIADDDGLPYGVREAARNFPVTLYSSDCGEPCANGSALLTKRGVPFSAKYPAQQIADNEALKKLTGLLEVPVLIVGNKVLKGFNESQWNEALDVAGYPKTSLLRSRPTKPAAAPEKTGSSAARNFPVILYNNECGQPCDRAKELLAKRSVPFSEKDPQDPAVQEKLRGLIGPELVIPVMTVGTGVLRGFDATQWNNALDQAGYPKGN